MTHKNKVICEVKGSWLEYPMFGDIEYWRLEETDVFKPIPAEKCLPSDCRFRTDSIAFDTGDMSNA